MIETDVVVVDTMVVSAIANARRDAATAASYRALIGNRSVLISVATVTEMRYGAIKAGGGTDRANQWPERVNDTAHPGRSPRHANPTTGLLRRGLFPAGVTPVVVTEDDS